MVDHTANDPDMLKIVQTISCILTTTPECNLLHCTSNCKLERAGIPWGNRYPTANTPKSCTCVSSAEVCAEKVVKAGTTPLISFICPSRFERITLFPTPEEPVRNTEYLQGEDGGTKI